MRVLLIVLLLGWANASAHDAAGWIGEGNYHNSIGELCCGKQDCGYMVSGTHLYT